MIRRLINRLQGKKYGASCTLCYWEAGREDLTENQAWQRLLLHMNTRHGDRGTWTKDR